MQINVTFKLTQMKITIAIFAKKLLLNNASYFLMFKIHSGKVIACLKYGFLLGN